MSGTRVVTLLFTDLVGSTEISQRLGEDAAEVYRRTHFRLLREAVAAGPGQEVKNLGDGLMVVFDSPSDAVGCAVAMQQAVEHHNRRRAERIELRVGLHTGEVTHEDGDYFGTAVALTERLCKAAGPGQILASDVLRLIVGSRGGYSFRVVGPLDLKGIPEPVGAVEVEWEPTAEGVPLPHALAAAETNPFVGRDEERQKLGEALKLARSGERQLVFLVGEPGIGKSRLCSEFAQEVHGDGAIVLYGRCDEEALAPYQPFVEALRYYVGVCADEELHAQAAPVAGDLARLVPDLAQRLPGVNVAEPGSDAEADRLRLFDAVRSLLAAAAAERTVVLVLDDLHWADRPTLQLLRHLLRTESFPILLIGTYRETDLDRTHPLSAVLADIRRDHPLERLHLKGLDTDDIALALERFTHHEIGRRGHRLAEVLERTTDGNPFFILQILGHLSDTGRIYERDGEWTFDVPVEDLGIPEGVKEVIGRRISALSEGANRALGVSAVVGRDFGFDILEAVSGMLGDDLVDALDEAVGAGILLEVRSGRYSFAHALMRETLYEELTATRRVRLHRRVAAVLEEMSGGDADRFAAELAHHLLEAAQVAEVDKAIDYARRAASKAVSLLAYEEGARLYERALSALELKETPEEPVRLDLLLALGDARWRAGDFTASTDCFDRALELARSLGDAESLARAALGAVGPPESGSPHRHRAAALDEALAALPPTDSPLRTRVMARRAAFQATGPEEAEHRIRLGREAVEMARRTGDLRTIAYAMRAGMFVFWDPTETERQIVFADEILRLGEQESDRELLAYGHGWRSILLLWMGRTAEADEALDACARLAAELKMPFFIWAISAWKACRLAQQGEVEEAERLAADALDLGRRAVPDIALVTYAVQLGMIRAIQGRLPEIQGAVERQAAAFPDVPSWRCWLSYMYGEIGRREDAEREFEALAADGFAVPRDLGWTIAMASLSMACAYLEDAARARILYDMFEPYRGMNVVVGAALASAGSADLHLGLLAATMSEWEVAEQHFRDALEANQRMGARPYVAFTAHEYASMLLRRGEPGDHERAQELLDRALEIACDVGMVALEQRIKDARKGAPALG